MDINARKKDVGGKGWSMKTDAVRLLSLYTDAPQEELTIDEFEMFAWHRLQLLYNIEKLRTSGFEGDQFNNKMKAMETLHMPLSKEENVRADHASHFILRLAYCRTEDKRRWFSNQEVLLFKYRLERLDDNQRADFMATNGLYFEQVSPEDKNSCKAQLIGLSGIIETNFIGTKFYKVPYTQALSLVSRREVFLKGGFAYVPLQRLVSIIVNRFRMNLNKSMAIAFNAIDAVADSRILPLLKNMNHQTVGGDYKGKSMGKLTPDKVDQAANQNMPLCMKHLHNGLKKEHKLKHWGRLQYGLFLKGAGMELDDASRFFESHFSKVMPHDKFQKDYAYSFRHMYGKEGARKNYTPYSCMKIIMGSPPEAGAFHGCPYRHMPESQLSALLGSLSIGGSDAKGILEKVKGGHYQIACQQHFDVTHPGHQKMTELAGQGDAVANHPNMWLNTSMSYYKIKTGGSLKEGSDAKAGAAAVVSPDGKEMDIAEKELAAAATEMTTNTVIDNEG